MNYLPTQKYREANLKIKSENDNPYEIVLDVLNELRNNIATFAYCFELIAAFLTFDQNLFLNL